MPPTPSSSAFLPHSSGPRLVLYAQTHHDGAGKPISLLPLLTKNTGVTHVIVAAIHLNEGPGNITLNDDPPSAEKFNTLWGEVRWLQGTGVKVLGMLGGAAKGSFERLSGDEASVSCFPDLKSSSWMCFWRNEYHVGLEFAMDVQTAD